ncbi:hypothetical protein, partial [Tropheryma whipplei]|uniref:hypothetical protein n=1 Tax=Tropheryma whipplei TaxID=2039 RepID=UPI0019D3CCAE
MMCISGRDNRYTTSHRSKRAATQSPRGLLDNIIGGLSGVAGYIAISAATGIANYLFGTAPSLSATAQS